MNAPLAFRPPHLPRTWLFVPGNDDTAHVNALASGADAVVADLEEMTFPNERPDARKRIAALLQRCAASGQLGGARINKLEHNGNADLEGVMPGRPHAIFLPNTESSGQLAALDRAIDELEHQLGIARGSTEIVPVIESAKGLVNLGALLVASARIKSCMLAVEDLATNLGARRTPDCDELLYARSRFLIECVAVGCQAVDLPCTWRSVTVLESDMQLSTQLGFVSRSVMFPEHVPVIHRALTPSVAEVRAARELLEAHRAQQVNHATGPTGSEWIDDPERNNAQRLITRFELFSSPG